METRSRKRKRARCMHCWRLRTELAETQIKLVQAEERLNFVLREWGDPLLCRAELAEAQIKLGHALSTREWDAWKHAALVAAVARADAAEARIRELEEKPWPGSTDRSGSPRPVAE